MLTMPERFISQPIAKASATPTAPPRAQSSTASIRNCSMIFFPFAPIAMRTPISLVRSITLTSMMFITPIPPTSSDIRATPEISRPIVSVVAFMVCNMVSELRI